MLCCHRRAWTLLAAVGLALALVVPAHAAIYGTVRDEDSSQTLTFGADCPGLTSVAYLTVSAPADTATLAAPKVGNPIIDSLTNTQNGTVTSIVRESNRFAVYAQADPSACAFLSSFWHSEIDSTSIEYTTRERLDGHCTDGDENLAAHGGFLGHVFANNVRCDSARRFVERFRFHGAGVGATFRYRGYRCHVSGHPLSARVRCTASRHRVIRWDIGD